MEITAVGVYAINVVNVSGFITRRFMGILKYTVNSKQPERRNMQLLANFQKGELERISVFIGGFLGKRT